MYDYRSIMHYRFIEPAKQRNHARPYAAETVPPGISGIPSFFIRSQQNEPFLDRRFFL